jgi:hypothetical protein
VIGFEIAKWLADVSYAQPANNSVTLAGMCCPTTDWYAQAGYQHHTTTYMSLLPNGADLPGVPAAPCPTGRTTRATLSKRLSRNEKARMVEEPAPGVVISRRFAARRRCVTS